MSSSFQVIYSQVIRKKLKTLSAKATSLGMAVPFQSAVRTVLERLQSDPLEFGEDLYSLRAAKLNVRLAIVKPLGVSWGVHSEKNLVFIKDFFLLSKPTTSEPE